MRRRRFFAVLAGLPLIGGWFATRAESEVGPRGPVPHEFADRFDVPVANISYDEPGLSARSIIVEGEDGRPYRLTDVLDGMFRMTEKQWREGPERGRK